MGILEGRHVGVDVLRGSRADKRKNGLLVEESERIIIEGSASYPFRPQNLLADNTRSKSKVIMGCLRIAVLSHGHADVGDQLVQGKLGRCDG